MTDHLNCPVSATKLLGETQKLTNSGTWCLDTSTELLYWSENTYAIFGRDLDNPPTVAEALEYYEDDSAVKLKNSIDQAVSNGESWFVQAKITTEAGQSKWVSTCGKSYKSPNGTCFLFGSIQDISESHKNIKELKQRTDALHAILDNLIDGVITIDENGIVQGFSKPAEQIFGYSADEVIGKNVKLLMPQPYKREHDQYLNNYKTSGKRKIIGIGREVIAQRKNGETFPIDLAVSETDVENGKRFIGMVRDITQQKETAQRIEFLSSHDELTGLANRNRFLEIIDAWSERYDLTVACLNIDYFRRINSVLGEEIGDDVICLVAKRAKLTLSENSILAKDLADRFIIAFPHPQCDEEVSLNQIDSLLTHLREPMQIEKCREPIHITVSIGAAHFRRNTNAKDALVNAESALEKAKRRGRNRTCTYQAQMQSNLEHEYWLETGLNSELSKLARGKPAGFECWLQSKVNRQFEVCGAEALIRWHYNGSLISPDEFIPLAERLGLITDIGTWMLREVSNIIKRTALPIAINVSPKQFLDTEFPDKVCSIMTSAKASFEKLIIEITENLLLHDHEQVISVMNKLSKVGVKFSIDDFGTGYSNLRRLQVLPFSELKIDRDFTQNAFKSERDRNLLDSIILMAKQMNVSIVAEGVEDNIQATYLKESGVDLQQGYFFAKPIHQKRWIY